MLIDETVMKALKELEEETHKIVNSNNLSNKKLESYLVKLEQKRFIILERLKINNKILDGYENEIKTINSKYKCDMKNGIIKIYIPETIPYYKNNNTYAYKNILLNLIDVLEEFKGSFTNEPVYIYIHIFDCKKNWDIDNKFIKVIPDALVLSNVIKDDNIEKMFYCVKGEYDNNSHTEVYIMQEKLATKFFKDINSKKCSKLLKNDK